MNSLLFWNPGCQQAISFFEGKFLMPIYEYQHVRWVCPLGKIFEAAQSMYHRPLAQCPNREEPIFKLISQGNVNTGRANRELKDLGFTKLVRWDSGVYENVTDQDGESKVMLCNKPETFSNLRKMIM